MDHQEGDAQIKELTGAQVMAMEQDVPLLRNITPGDKPHPIDRVLHDRDTVGLGSVTLTALLTAGHSEGCTTYTMQAQEGDRTYDVVFGCGFGAGGVLSSTTRTTREGSKISHAPTSLREPSMPDVFLGSHGHHYGLLDKLAKVGGASNPFY